jgi:predicted transcriptional regulator
LLADDTNSMKKPYTIRLDDALKVAAERCAEHENWTVTNLIETAVRDYCRARGFLPSGESERLKHD